MRKTNNELVRIQSLIENDRLSAGENFEELIIRDLHKILIDYFEYKGFPEMKITKKNHSLDVEIYLNAQAIKNFGTIPKS